MVTYSGKNTGKSLFFYQEQVIPGIKGPGLPVYKRAQRKRECFTWTIHHYRTMKKTRQRQGKRDGKMDGPYSGSVNSNGLENQI
jgi:hypothetical protein